MADSETKEEVPTQESSDAPAKESGEKGFGLSSYGNSAGDKVDSTLGVVGKPLGKGLAAVGAPVGGLVGSVVDNGIMQGGRAAGGITGKGAGAMDTSEMEESFKAEDKVRKEDEGLREGVGGKEQTGENPLGL
ncbi:hypothetical protein MMC27_000455 [Xylographa pallens]|nr:hypothetical protein [Xylographa pallens]